MWEALSIHRWRDRLKRLPTWLSVIQEERNYKLKFLENQLSVKLWELWEDCRSLFVKTWSVVDLSQHMCLFVKRCKFRAFVPDWSQSHWRQACLVQTPKWIACTGVADKGSLRDWAKSECLALRPEYLHVHLCFCIFKGRLQVAATYHSVKSHK